MAKSRSEIIDSVEAAIRGAVLSCGPLRMIDDELEYCELIAAALEVYLDGVEERIRELKCDNDE